ncbi:lysine N(6)-hydroxylase/L-ornithine N(5)-oxygenase family protein [Sinorhizobium meliloti]|uniref:lysine N(6)-hydroxylase/L-ornithine N(5)-oxygenase family protein n=1 Tax=Rhizobium meliloti TaxID=382 RepID=UPI003F16F26B
MTADALDLAGIGIGPFNLSLAAQLDSIPTVSARFFERRREFAWHPGMMLPGVEMQTSILKDLVTATNPTSPWSFLSYLVAHRRFYQFLNAEYEAVPRREFADYLGWVARGLTSLTFDAAVEEVRAADGMFSLRIGADTVLARNLSIGVGKIPALPAWAEALPKTMAFHNSEAADRLRDLRVRRIAVIGGGQSGAEIVDALLDSQDVGTIEWISRRPNFEPLDATPFTNELFNPAYVGDFHRLPESLRLAHTHRQLLASDGISAATLKKLYRRLYEEKLVAPPPKNREISLRPHRNVIAAAKNGSSIELTMQNGFDNAVEQVVVDAVILATGYRFVLPDFMESLKPLIAVNSLDEPVLAEDFSLVWDGPADNRIFVLNAGRHSHGIAEPQLSLAAWRSAVIANALLGRDQFDLGQPLPIVRWASDATGLPQSSYIGEAAE